VQKATTNLENLVLNGAALSFVLDLDELLFGAFAPERCRKLISSMRPLERPHRTGAHLQGIGVKPVVLFTIGVALLSVIMEKYVLVTHEDLTNLHHVLCGGRQQFAFSVHPSFNYMQYAETSEPHEVPNMTGQDGTMYVETSAAQCADDRMQINSVAGCQKAAEDLGMHFETDGSWQAYPSNCFKLVDDKSGMESVYFNHEQNGGAHSKRKPICMVQAANHTTDLSATRAVFKQRQADVATFVQYRSPYRSAWIEQQLTNEFDGADAEEIRDVIQPRPTPLPNIFLPSILQLEFWSAQPPEAFLSKYACEDLAEFMASALPTLQMIDPSISSCDDLYPDLCNDRELDLSRAVCAKTCRCDSALYGPQRRNGCLPSCSRTQEYQEELRTLECKDRTSTELQVHPQAGALQREYGHLNCRSVKPEQCLEPDATSFGTFLYLCPVACGCLNAGGRHGCPLTCG